MVGFFSLTMDSKGIVCKHIASDACARRECGARARESERTCVCVNKRGLRGLPPHAVCAMDIGIMYCTRTVPYIYILAAVRCAVCVCTRESVCAHGSLVQIMAIDVRSPVLIYVRVTTSVYTQESITCSISILCNLIGLPFGFGTRAEQRVMRSKFHFSFTGVNKCSRIATCW